MVTLNFTIIVEVSLFLMFMWLMHKFVFKPLLCVMDERDAKIENDKADAQQETERAAHLEKDYTAKLTAMHRAASHEIVRAHRKSQEEHLACVAELKCEEERQVSEAYEKAHRALEAERAKYPELTAALANEMAMRLDLKRDNT